eukprot:scaffold705877_cov149-Attheya_sp.AAC.1
MTSDTTLITLHSGGTWSTANTGSIGEVNESIQSWLDGLDHRDTGGTWSSANLDSMGETTSRPRLG